MHISIGVSSLIYPSTHILYAPNHPQWSIGAQHTHAKTIFYDVITVLIFLLKFGGFCQRSGGKICVGGRRWGREHCVRLSLNFLDIGMWAGTASPSPLPKECQYVLYTPGAPIQGHSCRSLLSCISPMTASVCV